MMKLKLIFRLNAILIIRFQQNDATDIIIDNGLRFSFINFLSQNEQNYTKSKFQNANLSETRYYIRHWNVLINTDRLIEN